MNRTFLVTLAAALLAAPLAFAHAPAGTPKNYCEPTSDWSEHDYGPPAAGVLLAGFVDGNLAGDCSGATLVQPSVTPNVRDPLETQVDLGIDPPFADRDGHSEFAFGGAWLLVDSGTGAYNPGGSGSLYRFGEDGHHAAFGPIVVTDVVLGVGVA